MSHPPGERRCDECGSWVPASEPLYRMRVELAAEPWQPSLPDSKDTGDVRGELEALIRRLEDMTLEQVAEATAQVHELFEFKLCAACRRETRRLLRSRLDVEDSTP